MLARPHGPAGLCLLSKAAFNAFAGLFPLSECAVKKKIDFPTLAERPKVYRFRHEDFHYLSIDKHFEVYWPGLAQNTAGPAGLPLLSRADAI